MDKCYKNYIVENFKYMYCTWRKIIYLFSYLYLKYYNVIAKKRIICDIIFFS